jgi:hypothetical protein
MMEENKKRQVKYKRKRWKRTVILRWVTGVFDLRTGRKERKLFNKNRVFSLFWVVWSDASGRDRTCAYCTVNQWYIYSSRCSFGLVATHVYTARQRQLGGVAQAVSAAVTCSHLRMGKLWEKSVIDPVTSANIGVRSGQSRPSPIVSHDWQMAW